MTEQERMRATLERLGLAGELPAWERSRLGAERFDGWVVDRVARRPEGEQARAVYGAEEVHDFARRALLGALALTGSDRLLEVGCGGGLLLRDAGRSCAAVTGLDHSAEMLELARSMAPGATLVRGDAEDLPFAPGAFTAVASSMVLLFMADPRRALAEAQRVLAPTGRIAVYTPGPELRGTPAAPEPIASHARFFDTPELQALARDAGFEAVVVTDDDGARLLTGRRPARAP